MNLRDIFSGVLVLIASASACAVPVNPFFAMDTGTKDDQHATFAAQAELVRTLGYAGYGGTGFADVEPLLKALDARGLKLFSLYVEGKVNQDGFHYDKAGMEKALPLLKGRDVTVWVPVSSDAWKPSDPAGDATAVRGLLAMADLAAQAGARIALYPHSGCWMERAEDALRVAEAVDRPNVGVTFNLCHYLKVSGFTDPTLLLQKLATRLSMVTVSGAEPGDSWDKLIQTLDRGSYNLNGLLQTLSDIGYTGPVGLQAYGIGGSVADNLKRSMAAWQALNMKASGVVPLENLAAFRDPLGDWTLAGDVAAKGDNPACLDWTNGIGTAVNGPKGKTAHLVTKAEYGDVELHIEFMMAKGSNSGVYFQGRYEIQVFDSWGVEHPKYIDCGGIYQRWHEEPGIGDSERGYEGAAPLVNAARKPGVWQSFDVIFRAPRFDVSGKKSANAVFVKVVHNGVLIHENVEVTGPTRASLFEDEKPLGPLMLQGDHGPVAYRNLCIQPVAVPTP
jgi:sugar phosphate isomerase/epimerase